MSSENENADCTSEPKPSDKPSNSEPKPSTSSAGHQKRGLTPRNIQYNRRKWRKLAETAEKWIEVQGNATSPFLIMRLNKGLLEWCGPSFMQTFAEDKFVISKFKEAAKTRPAPFIGNQKVHANRRTTPSLDEILHTECDTLTVPSLRRLITAVCNPKGRSAFWTAANRPSWWPVTVPFQSPNWIPVPFNSLRSGHSWNEARTTSLSPGGGSKLHCHQLSSVFQAYKSALKKGSKCPDQNQRPSTSSTNQPPQPSVSERIMNSFKMRDYKLCLSVMESLSWEDLTTICSDMIHIVNNQKPVPRENLSVSDFPAEKVDERHSKLVRMPHNFAALRSTGDGDCLFHSLSVLFHGTEEASLYLRLAVTVYSVCHASHYVSRYFEDCSSVQAACAFMHMMCVQPEPGTSVADWSAKEILCYTIQNQAASTAKANSYSGILQVLFAAGYLGVYIQQHSQDQAPGCDALLSPCACSEHDDLPIVHVMWVKLSSNGVMNHFIPIVPRRHQSRKSGFKGKEFNLEEEASNFCHACLGDVNMCQAEQHPNTWIQCEECASRFHCLCTGVSLEAAQTITFICCTLNDMTSVAKFDGTQVTMGDMNRLRRREDISGDCIDFFLRHIINDGPAGRQDVFVLPYFVGQLLQPNSWLHTLKDDQAVKRMQEHLKTVGTTALHLQQTGKILFPVCVLNHWVGVVVQKKANTLYILDSLTGFHGVEVYNHLHSFVTRYLYLVERCADERAQVQEQVFIMDIPKVNQQVNTHDCGIFLLANFDAVINAVDFGNLSATGVSMRRLLLYMVHRSSMFSPPS
ncbi:uncharacterized protein [Asterias amurensis]|uniref:uncharacterized protein n=1 Tax=Asterias amurensis TaxID=7602 RepID=UPI003AB4AC35